MVSGKLNANKFICRCNGKMAVVYLATNPLITKAEKKKIRGHRTEGEPEIFKTHLEIFLCNLPQGIRFSSRLD